MEIYRTFTPLEEKLLEHLIKKSPIPISTNWKEGLLCRSMNDGGMGSVYLLPAGFTEQGRMFGQRVSEQQWTDADGVPVIASLHTDFAGYLFELEIWKIDFSPLSGLPDEWEPL